MQMSVFLGYRVLKFDAAETKIYMMWQVEVAETNVGVKHNKS